MVNWKPIGQFVLVTLPTIFLLLWTLDAALVLGRDVFLVAGIQLAAFALFFWKYHNPQE